MLENLNFRAFFVRIVAMTSVQNRDFSFGENLYITARLIHPPGSHTMRLYRPCPTPRDRCDINSQIYGTPLNKLRQISPKTSPVRQGNVDSCRNSHIYSEFFLNLKKSKIRQYDKGIRNGKLPGLHTGQAGV